MNIFLDWQFIKFLSLIFHLKRFFFILILDCLSSWCTTVFDGKWTNNSVTLCTFISYYPWSSIIFYILSLLSALNHIDEYKLLPSLSDVDSFIVHLLLHNNSKNIATLFLVVLKISWQKNKAFEGNF